MNTFLLSSPLVLVFAGLLPNNPAAAQQAITPENHQGTATAEQETGVKGILATVTQSRSTNTLGYRIVIYDDGSAIAEITYGSKTSGDLQCIRQQAPDGDQAPLQASEDLGRFVQKTLGQLKINDRRIGSNQ